MSFAALSRYHRARLAALVLGVAAFALGGWRWAGVIAGAMVLLIAAGVVFPHLRFFGPYLCRGPGARRWVALTFDDGPDEKSTPALLDLLRESGVQAAFFCVGRRVAASPELTARLAREGHLVANHSYAHSPATNLFTAARLRADLMRAQEAIEKATGVTPRWFRPPMGLSNPFVFRAARSLDLAVVGWTARGLDTVVRNPERVANRIARRVSPGAIILLHDGGVPPERLLATVKLVLATVRSLGYEVVRLDRMFS